jgi:hypothetical protein
MQIKFVFLLKNNRLLRIIYFFVKIYKKKQLKQQLFLLIIKIAIYIKI